jgi:hypothetical protein
MGLTWRIRSFVLRSDVMLVCNVHVVVVEAAFDYTRKIIDQISKDLLLCAVYVKE